MYRACQPLVFHSFYETHVGRSHLQGTMVWTALCNIFLMLDGGLDLPQATKQLNELSEKGAG